MCSLLFVITLAWHLMSIQMVDHLNGLSERMVSQVELAQLHSFFINYKPSLDKKIILKNSHRILDKAVAVVSDGLYY